MEEEVKRKRAHEEREAETVAAKAKLKESLNPRKLADDDADIREAMDAIERHDEEGKRKEQEPVRSRKENKKPPSLTRSTPRANGMLSRATVEYESNSVAEARPEELIAAPAATNTHNGPVKSKISCTPFIPHGRS